MYPQSAIGTSFGADALWLSGEFTDTLGWHYVQLGGSIRYGDLDGDGRADVCGRGDEKVICAKSSGSEFTSASTWGFEDDFSDSEGWGGHEAYWMSMAMGDIDGDGGADDRGRGADGIWCAHSLGGSAFDEKRRVARTFTDSQGWKRSLYGPSFRLTDIDGDSKPDFCARGYHGILCVDGF